MPACLVHTAMQTAAQNSDADPQQRPKSVGRSEERSSKQHTDTDTDTHTHRHRHTHIHTDTQKHIHTHSGCCAVV